MEEIARLVLVQQARKALETAMGEGVKIVKMPGGGVREKEVKAPVKPQGTRQLLNPALHLPFRIKVHPVPIAERTAKAQNPDAVVYINLIFHADAAFRRVRGVHLIVIAPDVQERTARHGH